MGWIWILRVPLGKEEESVDRSKTRESERAKIHSGEKREEKYNTNNSGYVGLVKLSLVPCWARATNEGGRNSRRMSHRVRKTGDEVGLLQTLFSWCLFTPVTQSIQDTSGVGKDCCLYVVYSEVFFGRWWYIILIFDGIGCCCHHFLPCSVSC